MFGHETCFRSPAYEKLRIHLSHNSDNASVAIAKNILITHLISSDGFDPKNKVDLSYIWDVWYSFQWLPVSFPCSFCSLKKGIYI